jgi:uncharacterized membrane protein
MTYLAFATFFSGLTFFLAKVVTTKIHPLLGNLLSIITALGVQLVIFSILKWRGTEMPFSSNGMYWAILMGVFVGLYTVTLFQAFSQLDVSKATPILYLGSLAIATLLGVLFLKESFNVYNIFGLVLATGSIVLLLWK